jgi:hypothetical protein
LRNNQTIALEIDTLIRAKAGLPARSLPNGASRKAIEEVDVAPIAAKA